MFDYLSPLLFFLFAPSSPYHSNMAEAEGRSFLSRSFYKQDQTYDFSTADNDQNNNTGAVE